MYQFIEKLNFNIIIVEIFQRDNSTAPEARIAHLNQAASRLLGYTKQELINKPLECILAPENSADFFTSEFLNLKTKVSDKPFECSLMTSAGLSITTLISLSSLSFQTRESNEVVLLIQNISDRKQQEKKLFMMHMAVEQSSSAVLITDFQGRIEYVNPKFTALTGYTADELLGNNPRLLQSGSTTPEEYQAMWELLIDKGEWRGEIKNRKKNGQYYWAHESISAIKNTHGEITHFLAVEEDITQRKQVEAALTESEERFRQMAEMTGEWLWEQDPDGYYIYSSAAVNDILGINHEEIIGKHYTELLTLKDKEILKPNAAIEEPFYSLINHYRHKDGHQVFAESTGLPIKNASGKIIKWRGVDRDITARKHFQDQLVESEKRKRLIVESALNSIIIMDSYGIITDWNNQAEKMFGWQRDEAIGQRLDKLIIPPRFRHKHRQGLETFLSSHQGAILNKLVENVAIRRDGSEFPVELSVSPLKLGNAFIFSGFIHDITARKEAEQKIRQAQVNLAIARNEIEIAHRIQSSLLPATPITSENFAVTGFCLPADQVGGDYYDYFMRDDDHLDMVIADVSGHAVGPALFMVETRSALRTQANWPETPAKTLTVLNNFLFEDLNNADYFITMFYLQYHPNSEQLHFANAGHPPALLLHHNQQRCSQLDADGLILGVRKKVEFEEKVIRLHWGDMLLLYTDGITEAENHDGEFFGVERIAQIFIQYAHLEPREIIDKILEKLKGFCQTESFNDDITLMIFKCT